MRFSISDDFRPGIGRRPKPCRSRYPGCAPTLTPRAFASSTVRRMMSGSPAWKPQATLTELASSIMAASLPISHAPKPSPRSQLRSIVFMVALRSLCRLWLRRHLPGPGIHGAHRIAGDVGIAERLDVERDAVGGAQAIRQVADQLRELPGLVLRLGHADRLEAERGSRRGLGETADIGRGHRCDL